VIAGFPGETDRDFKELLEFVREARFERLGAFIYSKEPGTRASAMKPQVPGKAKKARFDEVMKLQRAISSGINSHFLGKTLDVLVDEPVKGEKGVFVGRTYADAPEIDGGVYVSGKGLKTGEFYKVKITDALEYDLVGEAEQDIRVPGYQGIRCII
jgi:ribosomal protein S12 methylthiotransferase